MSYIKWTTKEESLLKNYYPIYGLDYCYLKLKRSKASIKNKRKTLGLSSNNLSVKPRYYKENLEKITKISKSYSDCLRKMNIHITGGSVDILKKYIKKYNINIEHFNPTNIGNDFSKIKIKDILIENSTYRSTCDLKERLYKEGLKERICELCGQNEIWNGEKMSLILDHINGINNDNRIKNLRIVCPNCNATLPTHCRGNKRICNTKLLKKKKELIKINYQNEKRKNNGLSFKQIEYHKSKRKVERPPYNQLIKEIDKLGYCKTGRKYGVSDNSIRKWKKQYEKII